ncbi:class I SAM-dependent methyltransferase [Amycolatopsis minnesotensis]|uniref:Class I SAM-dependent methyltransferase n=1 Tax=Amycolatopsis minnesotensis TaxID=337894 RepID=A0ABP5DX06_9PSEU
MALVRNPRFARWFAKYGARNEARGNARLRAELLDGLTGTVVEVGAGTGLNFRHYPGSVGAVTAVEPEPSMRAFAERAASEVSAPIQVVDGMAQALPLDDASVDAVVVSAVLCSVADPREVLAEFRRVLRPGGELRFYEHVLAPGLVRRWAQRAAAPLWARLMGGCRTDRDTLATLRTCGFEVVRWREFVFPPGARFSLVGPRIHGVAVPR